MTFLVVCVVFVRGCVCVCAFCFARVCVPFFLGGGGGSLLVFGRCVPFFSWGEGGVEGGGLLVFGRCVVFCVLIVGV